MKPQNQGQVLAFSHFAGFLTKPKRVSPGLCPLKNPQASALTNAARPQGGLGELCGKQPPEGWGLGRILPSESPGPSLFVKGRQTLTPRSPPLCQTW